MGGGMQDDTALVERILAFEVDEDPGTPLGFRDRLARENGWSPPFAARVYDEYRRFLVLAATGDRAVTPSDEVDQAWHLHLTYTRSYWDRLCAEVLGAPLHHGPTRGTAADGSRSREQYASTLDRYREVFGTPPPADIWPGVAERFRDPSRWQRVDTEAHLVVRRAPLVAGGAAALLVGASTAATARDGSDAGVIVVLAIVSLVVIVGVAILVAVSRRAYRAGQSGSRSRRWSDGGGGAFLGIGGDGGDAGDHDSSGGCGGGDSGGGSGCGGGGCGGGD